MTLPEVVAEAMRTGAFLFRRESWPKDTRDTLMLWGDELYIGWWENREITLQLDAHDVLASDWVLVEGKEQ